MTYRIKNWKKFQHFKNRRPPWIKLYRDILDDIEWFNIPDESKSYLVMFWLLASEDKSSSGYLPDIKEMSFRLRKSEEVIIHSLSTLSHWVEQDDIKVISGRYRVGSPERETERERETEKEKEKNMTPTRAFKKPTSDEISKYCQERNNSVDSRKFFDFYQSKGWMVGKNKMKDWKACVRTWEKNDYSGGGQNGRSSYSKGSDETGGKYDSIVKKISV
jgi:hypothetical protein